MLLITSLYFTLQINEVSLHNVSNFIHLPQSFIHYTMIMPICCELAFQSDYTILEKINFKKLLIM